MDEKTERPLMVLVMAVVAVVAMGLLALIIYGTSP